MDLKQKINKLLNTKQTQNNVGTTQVYNTVNLDRLCELQNRNDANFRTLKQYINKESDVNINQSVLYEIAFDYFLTHQAGTQIIETIQEYELYKED